MAEEISYRRFTTKSLVFFKRIICGPQESPRSNSGMMMPCCFFPPAALSLCLYEFLTFNSYHQDLGQWRCGSLPFLRLFPDDSAYRSCQPSKGCCVCFFVNHQKVLLVWVYYSKGYHYFVLVVVLVVVGFDLSCFLQL
jgi:hypothetical protein